MAYDVDAATIAGLGCFAFLAGFIDSIVGGGGLIQLPAMLLLLPGVPVPTVFGTGKISSLAGTTAITFTVPLNEGRVNEVRA